MKLDDRLNAVLKFIDASDIVADIGADHGYLSKAMLDKGIKRVQVVENKIGPLNNAERNLKNYANVSFSLSDGIEAIDDDIDTCVICGMGGFNIIDILSANLKQARKFKKIILQPNSHVEKLRLYLSDNHFHIIDEDLIQIDKHFYHIIVLDNQKKNKKISEKEILFGPVLLKKQPIELLNKYQMVVNVYKEVLKGNLSDVERDRITKEIKLICDSIHGVKYES